MDVKDLMERVLVILLFGCAAVGFLWILSSTYYVARGIPLRGCDCQLLQELEEEVLNLKSQLDAERDSSYKKDIMLQEQQAQFAAQTEKSEKMISNLQNEMTKYQQDLEKQRTDDSQGIGRSLNVFQKMADSLEARFEFMQRETLALRSEHADREKVYSDMRRSEAERHEREKKEQEERHNRERVELNTSHENHMQGQLKLASALGCLILIIVTSSYYVYSRQYAISVNAILSQIVPPKDLGQRMLRGPRRHRAIAAEEIVAEECQQDDEQGRDCTDEDKDYKIIGWCKQGLKKDLSSELTERGLTDPMLLKTATGTTRYHVYVYPEGGSKTNIKYHCFDLYKWTYDTYSDVKGICSRLSPSQSSY